MPDTLTKLKQIADILPEPFEWCYVPAGKTTILGGQQMPDYKETFEVQPFYMGKYHITHAQFQIFIDAKDGFFNPVWWEGLSVADSIKGMPKAQDPGPGELPRERVCWYEMVAFCRWLTDKLGTEVRLPTEWEWQWAAQGDDGRAFPWGNELNLEKCNIFESGIGEKTLVDAYPEGASPFGVLDMAGNVWDWCLNEFSDPTNTDTQGDARRTVRGGAWNHPEKFARIGGRWFRLPNVRGLRQGFRVMSPEG